MRRVSIADRQRTLLIFLLLFFSPARAFAYRPFVSTDAAVSEAGEVEIELGYFNWERNNRNTTFIVPKAVLNYGVIPNLELVGEFAVEEPRHSSARLVDAALSLKTVLKEGVLQEKEGLSFAAEAGPLLPSTNKEEKRFGLEGIGIVSGSLNRLTYHLNFGGGLDRERSNPFLVWGIIAEQPVLRKFKLVAEINGESTQRKPPDNSALIGFIWEISGQSIFIDLGLRRGISRAAADWTFTTGLTFGFSPSSAVHN